MPSVTRKMGVGAAGLGASTGAEAGFAGSGDWLTWTGAGGRADGVGAGAGSGGGVDPAQPKVTTNSPKLRIVFR